MIDQIYINISKIKSFAAIVICIAIVIWLVILGVCIIFALPVFAIVFLLSGDWIACAGLIVTWLFFLMVFIGGE